jgi:hypothetical protein
MGAIATLIRRVLVEQEPPERVAKDVTDLAHRFSTVRYCFDGPDR